MMNLKTTVFSVNIYILCFACQDPCFHQAVTAIPPRSWWPDLWSSTDPVLHSSWVTGTTQTTASTVSTPGISTWVFSKNISEFDIKIFDIGVEIICHQSNDPVIINEKKGWKSSLYFCPVTLPAWWNIQIFSSSTATVNTTPAIRA